MYTPEEIELGNQRLLELANYAESLTDWDWDFADSSKCIATIAHHHLFKEELVEVNNYDFFFITPQENNRLFLPIGYYKDPIDYSGAILSKDATKEEVIENIRNFVKERS